MPRRLSILSPPAAEVRVMGDGAARIPFLEIWPRALGDDDADVICHLQPLPQRMTPIISLLSSVRARIYNTIFSVYHRFSLADAEDVLADYAVA